MNAVPAIPTTYAGVQFRSRLEARWAAFFDLLDWEWEYEPLDLTGYIPDFIIDGDSLFEVKPIVRWPCPVVGCVKCNDVPRHEYDAAVDKIERSGWKGRHAFICGASVFVDKHGDRCLARCVTSNLWMPGAGYDFETPHMVTYWREAGNRVQWRSPR